MRYAEQIYKELQANYDHSPVYVEELIQESCPYRTFLRVKGEKGAQFAASAEGGAVQIKAPASERWTWVKAVGTLKLKPGQSELSLSSSSYGSALDCLVLTDDPGFTPGAAPRIKRPALPAVEGLKAEAVSPYSAKLSWQSVEGARGYNLYCGKTADFAPGQATLVASPDRNAFLDWGLKPGETLFYRVASMGGGEPSAAVEVATPKVERVIIEKAPAASVAFEAPKKDTYVLWLKLKQGQGGGSYINVKVDGKQGGSWTCAFDKLSDESWFAYDQWGRFDLDAGPHTLAIENKTKHTIQVALLTNDLSHRPEGHINTLRGW